MSTRSTIGKVEKGVIKSIYCHFDGYPEHVGKTLHQYYNSSEKIDALIALGSISCLRERVTPGEGEVHTYSEPLKDVTIAYHRDRGEDGDFSKTLEFSTKEDYFEASNECWAEWVYLYENNEWLVAEMHGSIPEWKKLEEVLSVVTN